MITSHAGKPRQKKMQPGSSRCTKRCLTAGQFCFHTCRDFKRCKCLLFSASDVIRLDHLRAKHQVWEFKECTGALARCGHSVTPYLFWCFTPSKEPPPTPTAPAGLPENLNLHHYFHTVCNVSTALALRPFAQAP